MTHRAVLIKPVPILGYAIFSKYRIYPVRILVSWSRGTRLNEGKTTDGLGWQTARTDKASNWPGEHHVTEHARSSCGTP